MEALIGLALAGLVAALFGKIFHKMGYSRWTGLLVIVPIVNLVWWVHLAFSEWPIERQLSELPDPDQRSSEDHMTLMFRHAQMYENRGEHGEALKLFEILADELAGKPGSHFAKHCADRLRQRVSAS